MQRILLSILFCPLLTSLAFSDNTIIGGLGATLGEVYEGRKNIIGTTTAEVPIYEFTPSKPLPGLNRYGLILTSQTNRIVEIWAWNPDVGSSAACREQKDKLEIVFDKKYEPYKNTFSFGDSVLYSNKGNMIKINCPISFGDDPIYLQYTSKKMEELRLEESLTEADFSDI